MNFIQSPKTQPKQIWELVRTSDSESKYRLLQEGWEPFAVTVSMGNEMQFHFRRIKEESK